MYIHTHTHTCTYTHTHTHTHTHMCTHTHTHTSAERGGGGGRNRQHLPVSLTVSSHAFATDVTCTRSTPLHACTSYNTRDLPYLPPGVHVACHLLFCQLIQGSQTCHLTVHIKGRLPTIILQQCIITQTFMNPSIVFSQSDTQCGTNCHHNLYKKKQNNTFSFPPSSSCQFSYLPLILAPPLSFPPLIPIHPAGPSSHLIAHVK